MFALHAGPPQIHVAVFQPRVFRNVDLVFHRERRSARIVQNPDTAGDYFDFAGGHLRVDRGRAAQLYLAGHRNHVLRAHLFGAIVNAGVHILVEHHLGNAVAVPQVHEHHAAMVAAAVYPAHQQNVFARVRGAQRAAGMGPAKVAQEVQSNRGFHIEFHQFSVEASAAAISSRVNSFCSPVVIFLSA